MGVIKFQIYRYPSLRYSPSRSLRGSWGKLPVFSRPAWAEHLASALTVDPSLLFEGKHGGEDANRIVVRVVGVNT